MNIHPTAIVSKEAEIADDVVVGPYTIIAGGTRIGRGTVIGAHVNIGEDTIIGEECELFQGAIVGNAPQDKKYRGEKSQTFIGNRNIIREYATINKGTAGGGGKTVLGDGNLIMCYVHIAHDCIIGDRNVLTSFTGLAGHIYIENEVVLAGMVGIHHFVRVGEMAFVGGLSKVTQDVPPYVMVDGNPIKYRGLNLVGLRRNKVSPGAIAALKEAYRVLIISKEGNLRDVLSSFKESEECSFPEVRKLVAFIEERADNWQGRYRENLRNDKR
ncbi:MAG: acyl-ACP--UDP-N-acetylglucosamine O-acyltransferase [Planctomycetes bacterium]|nr:acyl-ACP--UDP-N-acetylglucosamine O-acyltransferase [Planctomycetota bacterium]